MKGWGKLEVGYTTINVERQTGCRGRNASWKVSSDHHNTSKTVWNRTLTRIGNVGRENKTENHYNSILRCLKWKSIGEGREEAVSIESAGDKESGNVWRVFCKGGT